MPMILFAAWDVNWKEWTVVKMQKGKSRVDGTQDAKNNGDAPTASLRAEIFTSESFSRFFLVVLEFLG